MCRLYPAMTSPPRVISTSISASGSRVRNFASPEQEQNAYTKPSHAQRMHDRRRSSSKPIYIPTPDGPPATDSLLQAAIENKQLGIVSLILKIYDGIHFGSRVIIALLNSPDLAIMETLYNYDNGIVQFEWGDNVSTFVTEACKQPHEKIRSLLLFLIEHDAFLNTGGLPGDLAVHAAVCGGQSTDVVEAMLNKGGLVYYSAMYQTVLRERVDVIKLYMQFGVQGSREHVSVLQSTAQNEGNTDLIKLVGVWTSSWGDQYGEDRHRTIGQRLKNIFKRRR
jgi:hypothetical protein